MGKDYNDVRKGYFRSRVKSHFIFYKINLKEKKVEIYFPELSLCGDNAAMVGAQGYFEYVSGTRGDMTLNARATLDIDSVQ